MDQKPFNDAQGLNWPLIMSPFDQFMAANGVLVAMFQFLLLAQVATKNRFLTLFYGVLNSLVYVILGALLLGVAECYFAFVLCCGNCLVFFSATPSAVILKLQSKAVMSIRIIVR